MKQGWFLLLFIWLLFSSILTRCFTSVLLGTFFKTKPTLTVETIEDLVSNPDIKLWGRDSLNFFKLSKPKIYEILYKRLIDKNSETFFKLSSKPEVINDIKQRKAVILAYGSRFDIIKCMYFNVNLQVSRHKYNQQVYFTYISKEIANSKLIYQM